jgi:hypothetical protein
VIGDSYQVLGLLIKEDEMSGACGVSVGEEKRFQDFDEKSL